MNLHRSTDVAGWDQVPGQQRNRWQRLASKTNGVVTPGNVATAAGVGLVLAGGELVKHGKTRKGLSLIAVGFVMDFVDGQLSERTGTKSRLGAKLDIVSDKLKVASALHTLHTAELVKSSTAAHILAQNTANIVITAYSKAAGAEDLSDASLAGKLTAAAQVGTLVGGAATTLLLEEHPDETATAIAGGVTNLLEASAVCLGAHATIGYYNQATGSPS